MIHIPRKYTIEEVRNFVKTNSSCDLLSDTYVSCFDLLHFRCHCGAEFKTDFAHFKNQGQRSCARCARAQAARKRMLTEVEIQQRLSLLGCEYVSGDYKDRKSKITIRCSCGHLKEIRLNTALSGTYSGLCEECSSKKYHGANRFTWEDVFDLCAIRGLELVSTDYTNARSPIEVRCPCGSTFVTTWDSIHTMGKTRCDACTGRMSSGERAVESWLQQHRIEYVRQKQFPRCGGAVRAYRFDFYIPEIRTCIEFDGQQHFQEVDFSGKSSPEDLRKALFDTQCRDLLKDMYCEEHGLNLIRIRYDEIDQVSDILDSRLIPR